MTDYAVTLRHLRPDAEWSIRDNDYSTLVWRSAGDPPTQDECDAAWPSARDEVAWERVRAERDDLLSGSDWTQVADAPVDAAAWAVYRQALRDVPQDFASPDEVVWPTAP